MEFMIKVNMGPTGQMYYRRWECYISFMKMNMHARWLTDHLWAIHGSSLLWFLNLLKHQTTKTGRTQIATKLFPPKPTFQSPSLPGSRPPCLSSLTLQLLLGSCAFDALSKMIFRQVATAPGRKSLVPTSWNFQHLPSASNMKLHQVQHLQISIGGENCSWFCVLKIVLND